MAERIKVVTPPFRVSFPAVFEPQTFIGDDGKPSAPKYGVTMIFNPSKFSDADKKAFAAMKGILNEASMAQFKKKWADLPGNFKKGLRDGNEKADLEGYGPGTVFAAATSKQRPGLVDKQKQPILQEDEFYPGCWARATVTAYAYDNKGKGVAFGLHNLQKLGDGENFSGRVAAEEDFGDDASDVWKDDESAGDLEGDDPLS